MQGKMRGGEEERRERAREGGKRRGRREREGELHAC